jgi:putative FmdB family regulatory protein
MPLYEYTCEGCREDFELLVRSARSRPACPSCGSKALRRRFSTFAAHQGGSGTASPCDSGRCPAMAAGGGSMPDCASGKCPFS